MNDPAEPSDEHALVKLSALLVLGVGLTALFLGYGWFWMVFAVGFAVLVPLAKVLTDELGAGVPDGSTANPRSEPRTETRREPARDRAEANAPDSKQDALDALRTRYAQGELDEMEFERKVENLLETETLEGARDQVADRRDGDSHSRESGDAEPAAEDRNRDADRATER